jgi:hypothetical protein
MMQTTAARYVARESHRDAGKLSAHIQPPEPTIPPSPPPTVPPGVPPIGDPQPAPSPAPTPEPSPPDTPDVPAPLH